MKRLATAVVLCSGWRRAALAILAGALLVLTQAPFDFPAVGFVSFPLLVWLIDGATAGSAPTRAGKIWAAFRVGWLFGFGYFVAGVWWIGTAFLVEADAFAWALPFAVVGLPLYLALYHGLATALARIVWTDGLGRIAALAAAFAVSEWLRGTLLTGFPWNPLGFAAMPVPLLMQSVRLVGVDGMNALVVFVFALPALLVGTRQLRLGAALALLLLAGHVGYGWYRLQAPAPPGKSTLAVRIVQPDVDLSEKWNRAVRDRIFATMLELSSQPPAPGKPAPTVIVWPETSVPFLFSERPDALTAIADLVKDDQLLLAGIVREEVAGGAEPRYYNATAAIDSRGEIVDAVDKMHLVPFGEYIPFAGLFGALGLEQLIAGPMNYSAGTERHSVTLPGGLKAAPFICYEMIFSDEVRAGSRDASLLVNVTNDAWFGRTPGPYQHLRQAQIRAVETGLPVLRAANTGISAVIDPEGRIMDALALETRGVIDAALPIGRGQASFPQPQVIAISVVALFALFAAGAVFAERRRYS